MWSTSLLMSNLSRHSVLPLIAHPLLMDVESSSSFQVWPRTTDSWPNRDRSPGTIKEVTPRLDFALSRKLRLASFSLSVRTLLPRWCFFYGYRGMLPEFKLIWSSTRAPVSTPNLPPWFWALVGASTIYLALCCPLLAPARLFCSPFLP